MKIFSAALFFLALSSPALAETVAGRAKVIDGDTLEIGERRVRLFGVDAPEATQTCDRNGERWACGEEATRRLEGMMGGASLICSGEDLDQYGRLLVLCTVAGVDLNRELVAQGWATAFRRYSDRYVGDEVRARASKLGLWSSSFQTPEDFRAKGEPSPSDSHPTVMTAQVASPVSSCAIKGNRSRRGEWIYHLPGMPYYEQTRAEEMFCSEDQAQGAGYRRAKVN